MKRNVGKYKNSKEKKYYDEKTQKMCRLMYWTEKEYAHLVGPAVRAYAERKLKQVKKSLTQSD